VAEAFSAEDRGRRLRYLADEIRKDGTVQERFQQIWTPSNAARLMSEAGLPDATSLFRALLVRWKRRLIPRVEDDLDLYAALQSAEFDARDALWVAELGDEDAAPWRDILKASASDLRVAVRLLALRAAGSALSPGVMTLMPRQYANDSPFLELTEEAGRFAREPEQPEIRKRLQETIARCLASAGRAHARMEELGVSADLVFRLDLVIAQLERVIVILRVMGGRQDGRWFAFLLLRAVASAGSAGSCVTVSTASPATS